MSRRSSAKPQQPPAEDSAADRSAQTAEGSQGALARLETAITELKALTIAPLLRQAIEALRAADARAGSEWALRALEQDERSGQAWYVLAVARERAGDFASSLKAYGSALALLPDETQVAHDLGRLAYRMGEKGMAEQLFRRYLAAHPTSHEALNNLACAIHDQGRHPEAIELLRRGLEHNPADPALWNTLGSVVTEQGDTGASFQFFEEALRLDPSFAKARYNRGNARLVLGELEAALTDCDVALRHASDLSDRAMMRLARSTILLCLGRIGEGWETYEVRLDPQFAGATHFLVDAPRWTPEAELRGKTLLLMGEQGLGDEVLFASVVPDALEAVGPSGKVLLAVEPRLVELMQRSFPTVEVVGHATYKVSGKTVRGAAPLEERSDIDLWTPMASLLRRFRARIEDFPTRPGYLTPDAPRVAHWRTELAKAPPGRKVGLLWKSMKLDATRARYYSPFELWTPVLTTPGMTFVNIQYGDCAPEIAWAEQTLGVALWTPPGIDLKDDLDDIAALTSALDLTIGFANATSNIAAAVGAPTWMISAPGAWTRVGTDRMPWYPQARVFAPSSFGRWAETMSEVAGALAERFAV